jgi:DNA-directed RNA polymerase specialized sigma24 family protein
MDVPIEDYVSMIETNAAKIAARYDGIDADDVTQEIWVWWLSDGAPAVARYHRDGQRGRLAKAIQNAALNYCEREKKLTLGYDWRDDYNYSRPEVARLLPLALDPATIPGLSGGGLHDGPSAKADPAYGGGMLASIVDVRSAFGKLSDDDQEFVKLVVAFDSRWDAVGIHLGIQPNSAYQKYMRILDRMVTRHLGRVTDDDAA